MNRRAFISDALRVAASVAVVGAIPSTAAAAPVERLPDRWLPTPWPVDYRTVLPTCTINAFHKQKAAGGFAGVDVEEVLTDMAWFGVDAAGREAYRQSLFASPEHLDAVYAAYREARSWYRGTKRRARPRHWEATVWLFRGNNHTVRTWNDLAVAQGFGWKFPENVGRQQAWIQHHGFYLSDTIAEELLERGRRDRQRAIRREQARKAGAR